MTQLTRDDNFQPATGAIDSVTGKTEDLVKDNTTGGLHVHLVGEGAISSTGINGAPVTVGTTAVEMTFSNETRSINIMSDHDNSGKIWWGLSDVDSSGNNAFGRLGPGQAVTVELDDSSNAIYAVSDTATQTVYKVALT